MSVDTEQIRVRLILAKHPEDDEQPTIIGCMDETIWEHIDYDTEDRWRQRAREFFGAPNGYEYRECWAVFEAESLADVFRKVSVVARVEQEQKPTTSDIVGLVPDMEVWDEQEQKAVSADPKPDLRRFASLKAIADTARRERWPVGKALVTARKHLREQEQKP